MFVVGGSYKAFYLNELDKIKNVDLLIFNQGIFYEINANNEESGCSSISEIIALNQQLKCPILACGILNNNGIKNKCYILCFNKKISIIDYNKDVYLYIKDRLVLIGNKIYKHSSAFATISFIQKRCDCELFAKRFYQNYFLCDSKGVSYINRKRIYRKFRKYCYFTLSFQKKML